MGAVTGALGIASGAVSAVSGAAKFFEGRRMQRRAEEALANFEWQNLENPYEALQVSTLGADLQREEAGRFTSTAVDALQQAGTRGLVGGLGRVQQQNTLMNRQIGADLDMQQREIDKMAAGQDVRNQEMFEQRQREELQGLGKQMDTGIDMKYGAAGDIASGLESFNVGLKGMLKDRQQQNPQTAGGGIGQAVPGLSQGKLNMFSSIGGRMGGLSKA